MRRKYTGVRVAVTNAPARTLGLSGVGGLPVRFEQRPVFSDQPVPPQWFAALLDTLGPWGADAPGSPPVALAVSGGGDSLALAWLARRWRRNLLALVVDHGLRPESGAEARLTVERLHAMDVPARLITLTDLTKGPAMAARARKARYARMVQACQQAGCVDLLLGHQADDQAETAWMRSNAGSGPDGLAAMGWISHTPDVRLVRPLLGVSRVALRQTLRAAGLAWVDDPSNQDLRAERVRVRFALQDNGLSEQFWCLAMDAGAQRMTRERAQAMALAQTCAFYPHGWVGLGQNLPEAATLSGLIRTVGAQQYPPAPAAVARLCKNGGAGTLAGTQLARWRDEWFLIRELAGVSAPVAASPGVVWDGRFVLHAPSALLRCGVYVGAAGYGLARKIRAGWPALFCAGLPALWWQGQRVAVPHLGWCSTADWADVFFEFRPPVPVTGMGVYGCKKVHNKDYVGPVG
ncbi:tRNA lysidine(34) synthetase TilS [Acetobacter fabarum]|uniref:tRNA(Ile)-lysidine synthase n=1 Tax=Acetobacter fabarum TaxID=483199 RepID=A0A269XZ79_9PROT|nr:tRNA lysidine(34) synthetase TilS [Acetobacter fabarum]PEN26448.1 tRNA lysidine(34) synthetase TilS [Acetobacter fabarum]